MSVKDYSELCELCEKSIATQIIYCGECKEPHPLCDDCFVKRIDTNAPDFKTLEDARELPLSYFTKKKNLGLR